MSVVSGASDAAVQSQLSWADDAGCHGDRILSLSCAFIHNYVGRVAKPGLCCFYIRNGLLESAVPGRVNK